MNRPCANLKSDVGAALLLSLWALFLLSAMVIAWALSINSRLIVSRGCLKSRDLAELAKLAQANQ
jgi:hypothetical protein